jgi:seryl-tRNA synthetase
MQQDEERQKKAMTELKKQYESKVKADHQIESIRQKMKDIKRDVDEANEIAKFMNKDIQFTHIYVSKFDEQSVFSGSSNYEIGDSQTDVQVKVENFEIGQIHIWSCDKFNDKLDMMRAALNDYENNLF